MADSNNNGEKRSTRFKPGNKAAAGSRAGGRRPKELTEALDGYTLEGMALLWRVANDPEHEWHKKFGFDALKNLVQHCSPKRKEISGGEGGPVEISLANLFYGDSLPKDDDGTGGPEENSE